MKDLIKANRLIEDIAKKHKEITPVTPKDEKLFSAFFKNEPHTYGNSWTYVTQGMYGIGPYGLGYKYYDGKNLSAVCVYPKIEQPNTYCFYWVRPMGHQILDVINRYAKILLEKRSMPTYVKKIFKDQFEYLHKKGFKDTSKFPWHSSCPSEDDTLPELTIDLDKLFKNLSHSLVSKRLRRIYKMYNAFPKEYNIKLSNIKKKNYHNVWQATLDFFTYKKKLKDSFLISSEYDFYNMIFYPYPNKDEIVKMIIIDDKIVGFYSAERQSKNYAGLYGIILHRHIYKNITEFVMIKIFSDLHNKGVRYINLGGSEYKGVQDAKLKYHPTISQQMHWASLY